MLLSNEGKESNLELATITYEWGLILCSWYGRRNKGKTKHSNAWILGLESQSRVVHRELSAF